MKRQTESLYRHRGSQITSYSNTFHRRRVAYRLPKPIRWFGYEFPSQQRYMARHKISSDLFRTQSVADLRQRSRLSKRLAVSFRMRGPACRAPNEVKEGSAVPLPFARPWRGQTSTFSTGSMTSQTKTPRCSGILPLTSAARSNAEFRSCRIRKRPSAPSRCSFGYVAPCTIVGIDLSTGENAEFSAQFHCTEGTLIYQLSRFPEQ